MNYATVKRLLAYQSQDELFRIIAKLSSRNAKADSWLLEYCQKLPNGHGSGNDAKYIVDKQLKHYWSVARSVIKEANKYGGSSHAKKGYEALWQVNKLMKENDFSKDVRKSLIDEMMEEFYKRNSGFDDSLVKSCLIIAKDEEEKIYLAEKLKESSSLYYRRYAANMYMNLGKYNEFEEIMLKNLRSGADYVQLANYYKEKKEEKWAVQLVEKALDKVTTRMDEIYDWLFKFYKNNNLENKILALYDKATKMARDLDKMEELMCDYYKDDPEKRSKHLIKMVEVCKIEKIKESYETCKNALSKDDFKKVHASLLKTVENRHIPQYLDILLEEGREKEVLCRLQKNKFWENINNTIDNDHYLSRRLTSKYPAEVCEMYWEECEELSGYGSRDNYYRVAQILKEIRDIYITNKDVSGWNERLNEFMTANRRKRLLMECIEEEKLLFQA